VKLENYRFCRFHLARHEAILAAQVRILWL